MRMVNLRAYRPFNNSTPATLSNAAQCAPCMVGCTCANACLPSNVSKHRQADTHARQKTVKSQLQETMNMLRHNACLIDHALMHLRLSANSVAFSACPNTPRHTPISVQKVQFRCSKQQLQHPAVVPNNFSLLN